MRKTDPKYLRIDAELLIPGRGEPIENGSLVSLDSKIIFVGETANLPQPYVDLSIVQVRVLMPGLWDCHVHFFGSEKFAIDDMAATNSALAGARCARDVAVTLNAGYTSVREMGGYGVELSQAIHDGWLPGPNIYSTVSILSQTGGHGDAQSMSSDVLCDKIHHGLPFHICDGVDECIKAVRTQVRRGARVIKIAASGGVTSLHDDVEAQQFSDPEIRAIVEEAARSNRVVAAHCHGKKGIMAALRAGCHTIEHGTYLDDEAVELMLEKNAMLVATGLVVEYATKHPDAWSKEMYAQMLQMRESHKKGYALAIRKGVRIALGTDLGVSTTARPWNHGMNGGEFRCAVHAGMTPLQAIEAGTANAPHTLGGAQAPLSGQLKADYDADFIALSESPLDDIGVLATPEKISHVWKGGKLVKADGKPVGFL
ncbi:hypothetical protein MMC07_007752 [Pseudocyphellaria aurata]|nr:hypothetical protein [Pseudocyphellaria aurata]